MNSRDFLSDADGDILIEGGDFVVGDSDEQHVADILLSNKGDWRQNPAVGCNMVAFLKGNNSASLRERVRILIRTQLEYDGYRVDKLVVKDNLTTVIEASK
jgi:phage baseplate assembly protein W